MVHSTVIQINDQEHLFSIFRNEKTLAKKMKAC